MFWLIQASAPKVASRFNFMAKIKICPGCQYQNSRLDLFCLKCGASINKVEAIDDASEVSLPSPAPEQDSVPETPPTLSLGKEGIPSPPPTLPEYSRLRNWRPNVEQPGVEAKKVLNDRLEAVIGENIYMCKDGDVLGRGGSIAPEFFQQFGTVSRHHVFIHFIQNKWFVSVPASVENMTRVNGEEIDRDKPFPLVDEQVVMLSEQCMVLLRSV